MSSPIPFDSAIILFCRGLVAWNLEKKTFMNGFFSWSSQGMVYKFAGLGPGGLDSERIPFHKRDWEVYIKGTRFKSQTTGPQNTHLPLVEYTCTKN